MEEIESAKNLEIQTEIGNSPSGEWVKETAGDPQILSIT